MIEQKDIERFWKWCGLTNKKVSCGESVWVEWQDPQGMFIGRTSPDLNLSSIFRWAVPKLDRWGISQKEEDERIVATARYGKRSSQCEEVSPEEALFRSILAVIGDE